MNSNDLLDVIGEAKESYVLDAVNTRNGMQPKTKRLSLNRAFLIAAVIAMLLLLVGCTVAYVLSLQDLKIADKSYVKDHDAYGREIEPTEVTQDVISIRGYFESPNQRATKEWYEFEQTYDPEHLLLTDENELGIPDNYYYAYDCYTWEMVEKVDEIANKYGLKLLSPETVIQRWQIGVMFDALGIGGVCHEENAARVSDGAGCFYPEGNFQYEFEFLLPQEGDNWSYEIWATMYYTKKDYFDPDYVSMSITQYDQWHYTTADGADVLIAMKEDGGAFLFTEQEDAYITVHLDTTLMLDTWETERATKKDMELAADTIDFSMSPIIPDMTGMEEKLAQADREYEDAQAAAAEKASVGYATYSTYIKEKYIDGAEALMGTPFVRNYYALVDVTGDGVDELLLGKSEDHFRDLLTIRDGKVHTINSWSTMNLCENNVILITGYIDEGGEPISYVYCIASDESYGLTPIEEVSYDFSAKCWTRRNLEDENNNDEKAEVQITYSPISDEEFSAIIGKYPVVDITMKPLSEYPIE